MEQSGERRIAAPRDRVWAALNDPRLLQRCIEGCEAFERTGPATLTATLRVRVGARSGDLTADIVLKDIDPPNGWTMEVSARGAAFGFANGHARITLADDGGLTLVAYRADGSIGGKLAEVGERLLDASAHKRADDFFAAFASAVEAPALAEAVAAEASGADTPASVPTGYVPAAQSVSRSGALVWGAIAAVLIAVGLLAWRFIAS